LTLKQENEQLKASARRPRREQRLIQKRAKERVILLLGGKDTQAYFLHSKEYYRQLWDGFYKQFSVTSYWDTLLHDFDNALVWIGSWSPIVETEACFLCEEHPGTLVVEDGRICEHCAQIIGEISL
jgi:hypothetical protein